MVRKGFARASDSVPRPFAVLSAFRAALITGLLYTYLPLIVSYHREVHPIVYDRWAGERASEAAGRGRDGEAIPASRVGPRAPSLVLVAGWPRAEVVGPVMAKRAGFSAQF